MNSLQLTKNLRWITAALATALSATMLAGCSGGGAPTVENPIRESPPVLDYTGPASANADVQAFRINLWQNIKANNRCGGCHNAGGQTPMFARNDDVNLAYQAANTIVNLQQPDQSRMVTKVAGGHNCWLQSPAACADTLTADRFSRAVTWLSSTDDALREFLTEAGWAPDGAHRELDLHGDGTVQVKQVRLHTALA